MRKVDYDKIWEVYEIPKISKNKDRAKRKTISSYWDQYLKELGKPEDFPWEGLSKLEQDKFIYVKIKDLMKNRYAKQKWKDIEKKINRYIHNSPLAVEERIQTSNESKNNLYRNHRVTTHSDADKKNAYNALRSDIQAISGTPLPTREEFEKRLSLNAAAYPEEAGGEGKTKKQQIRAYDFIIGNVEIRLDSMLTMGVYVRIILKVLEEKHGLKVDYDMIDKCLLCREEFYEYCSQKGYKRDDDWDFPMEYDEKLKMTEEEYKELKERYTEYLFYRKKLNELKPLYKYEKEDDSKSR